MSLPKAPFQSSIIPLTSKITAVWQQWFDRVQIIINNITRFGSTSGRPTNNLLIGQPYFDTTQNTPVWWNGSAWVNANPGSSVVSAVTGTAPIASSGGSTPNISISQAGAASNGYLSSADWNTFNNKQPAGTYVNSVTGISPVVSSGGVNPAISMPAANGTTNGYLTSTDWNTFNNAGTFVNVKAYGATGNGSTNDTTAIQNAINANPGRTIYFPQGKYRIAAGYQVVISNSITLLGDNPQNIFQYGPQQPSPVGLGSCIVCDPGSTNTLFQVTTTGNVTIERLGFMPSSGGARTGGAYIRFATPSDNGANFGSRINNCQFYNGYYSIIFQDAAGFVVSNSYFADTSYVDIYVANVFLNDWGDSCITNNYMDFVVGGAGGSAYAHIHQLSSGGLKIIGNKLLSGQFGYRVEAPGTVINDVIFSGNSVELQTNAGVYISSTVGPYPNQIALTGNQFGLLVSGATGIILNGPWLQNVCVVANAIGLTDGTTGILLDATNSQYAPRSIRVSENQISGAKSINNVLYPTGTGISIQNGAYAHIGVNSVQYTETPYNIGSSNCIFDMGQSISGWDVDSISATKPVGPFYEIQGGSGPSGAFKRHYFPIPFKVNPIVNLTPWSYSNGTGNTGGCVNVVLGVVTTDYFEWYAFGLNSSGTIYVQYTAHLRGQ